MEIEKICQYLNEIGILEYENINIFLKIYSSLNNKNYSSEINRIIDTLKIYLNNNFIKNNQISKLCESIIYSYNNYQLISKYQSLNNMNNILLSKLRMVYIKFFLNLSLYLLKSDSGNKKIKNKNIGKKSKIKKNSNKYDKYMDDNTNKDEENIELISSDDERECTFTPQINKNFKGYKKNYINNNIESHVYYSPAFNIASKFPINKYQNNIYSNQSFTDNNMNNYSYSNLNISNDNRSNISYNQYGNNYNQFQDQPYNNEYNEFNMNYKNRNYYNANNFNNHKNIQQNYDNPNIIMNNQYLNNNNYNYSNISDNNKRNAELFFNKELYHLEKVKNKIDNLKKEKYNKIAEECTFKPKINTNYKSFYPEKEIKEKKILTIQANNKNNLESIKVVENKEKIKSEKRKRAKSEKKKFKILEDLSLAKKKRTDKTKKLMKERNFTPKITKNNKYKITMSFEDRRLKSIELRNKIKNAKKSDNDNNIINNVDNILAPGEMVRFKENTFNNNENMYLKQNNVSDNNNNDILNVDDKINLDNNKLINNENIKDDLKESKENNIMNFNNNDIIMNNNDFKEEINNNNTNENEIRQNNQNLINKLKEEHKIGFKSKKNEEKKESKLCEENNEQENKNDLDLNNKNSEFSFQNFHMRSKSLKDLLKKNEEGII